MAKGLPNAAVGIDSETTQSMAAFVALAGNQSQTSVTVTIPGELGFKAVAELKREFVIASGWKLDATAFVRVQRVLRDDESVVVSDTGGLLSMTPPEKRQELGQMLRSTQAKKLGLNAGSFPEGFPRRLRYGRRSQSTLGSLKGLAGPVAAGACRCARRSHRPRRS